MGCCPSFIEVEGVDILRAPVDVGAPATRRDMNGDFASEVAGTVVTPAADGDTTNAFAVAARARNAAAATDFMAKLGRTT